MRRLGLRQRAFFPIVVDQTSTEARGQLEERRPAVSVRRTGKGKRHFLERVWGKRHLQKFVSMLLCGAPQAAAPPGSQHEGYCPKPTDGLVLLENGNRSHRNETRCCNWTSRDTEESCGGRTALSVAQIQRCMGSFMGISTWSLRVKQKCWCVVALLVSLVQTRTYATGMLPSPPVERTMWCRGGKKTVSDTSVSLFSTYFPSHLEGVQRHLGGRRWMLCTSGLICYSCLFQHVRPRAEEPHDLIGTVRAGVKGDSATRFRALLRRHSIAVPQTFHLATPTFYGSSGRSRIDFVATPPSVQFSCIFVNFTAGRPLQLILAAGPRDHMTLTTDLVTNGMRHCLDPTRGTWDHEKIEEMLSDPVARLTFIQGT